MKRIFSVSALTLMTGFMLTIGVCHNEPAEIVKVEDLFVESFSLSTDIEMCSVEPIVEVVDIVDEFATKEEIELIALVTMAEAEGECELGKRLVIDTILNRVDHEKFPDSIADVIYQPNQFSSMWNGRVDRCDIDDDICELVKEELKERTNNEVVFFHANKYGKYGEPAFQVGNHYFSYY